MRIHVTADDIARGARGNSRCCPVAVAILRQTGHPCGVTASRMENPDGGRLVTPDAVADFVEAFDAGRPVGPFAFEIPDGFLPPEVP